MKILRIILFLLILNTFVMLGVLFSQPTGKVIQQDKEYANITKIIDGDTIEILLDNITQKVRMLGINTPEKNEKDWEKAKNFLEQFENKTVELVRSKEDKDKYNRKLRYIFYNNAFLNKEILENGWAHFYSYSEDKYTEELKKAEGRARENRIGIWESSKEDCGGCIFLIELNEIDPGEYIILGNNCSFDCNLTGWKISDDSSSHTQKLNFSIFSGGGYRIDYNGSVWNDNGDSLYLRDREGGLALFYRY